MYQNLTITFPRKLRTRLKDDLGFERSAGVVASRKLPGYLSTVEWDDKFVADKSPLFRSVKLHRRVSNEVMAIREGFLKCPRIEMNFSFLDANSNPEGGDEIRVDVRFFRTKKEQEMNQPVLIVRFFYRRHVTQPVEISIIRNALVVLPDY